VGMGAPWGRVLDWGGIIAAGGPGGVGSAVGSRASVATDKERPIPSARNYPH